MGKPGISVAVSSPPALIASRISGKKIDGHDLSGLAQRADDRPPRQLRDLGPDRRAHTAAASAAVAAGSVRVAVLARALERAAGLGQEHVVERRRVQLQVGDLDVLGVERPHHLGQRPPRRPRSRTPMLSASWWGQSPSPKRSSTRAMSCARERSAGTASTLDCADLGLERVGRALGHDLAVVDDPHAVGQHVGLLEVLGGEEDGHAVLLRQALDLLPQRRAALAGRGRWWARPGTGSAGRAPAPAPGRAAASCRPSSRRRGGRPPPTARRARSARRRGGCARPSAGRAAPSAGACGRCAVRNGSSAASCSAAPMFSRTFAPSSRTS